MSTHTLVVRLDSDGDVLLAGPAVRAVAAGAGHVTLLCGPRGRAAAELLPGVDERADVHEVERGLALVETLGHSLPPGDDGRLVIRQIGANPVPESHRPYVVVHPGAFAPARAWAPKRNAALVRALARKVVVTGGPGERALTRYVAGDQHAACAGSRARECPIAGHPCLGSVSVEEVVDAVERLAPSWEEAA